jgi:hypothetical protein
MAHVQNGEKGAFTVNAAPYSYEQVNAYTSPVTPSVVHTKGNALSYYFRKYLFLEAVSMVKWALPDTWPQNRMEYLVFGEGGVSVFNTDRYGLVYDHMGLTGLNVFYNPTHTVIANPFIKGTKYLQIGKQCEIIHLQPDYRGMVDIVAYYGDMMALAAQTIQSNLINSRLAYVFAASNKAGAESFKKMFDLIMQGNPAVFVDSALLKTYKNGASGQAPWMYFATDLKGNFITNELLEALKTIKALFDTEVGIPNTNTSKKERMLTDEVNSNNVETAAKASLWLDSLQRGCERVHKLFGLDKSTLWVDWRFPPDTGTQEVVNDARGTQL